MLPTKPMPPRCCFTDDSVSDPHSDILSRESINIESFPTDLLFEILLRLPADHLYQRVRLVCRRWCHIIHSHAFINAQMQMHGATYGLLLSPLNHNTYVTADAGGGIHISELNHISKLRFLATCNGLALEYDFKDYRVRLVNPATKQSLLLPRWARGVSYVVLAYGFAYSAASSAYKAIAPYTVCPSAPRPQTDYGLDVLTVGIDESWRHVEVHHLPDHVRPLLLGKTPLTSEGFLHWGWGRYCATMDVETEIITLSVTPYQYPYYYHESDYNYLSTGRCLTLLVVCEYLSWEVWEMKAETGEWRKALPNVVDLRAQKCRIQRFAPEDAPRVLKPLGWVKYPHVLAFYFDTFSRIPIQRCVLYNLDTHQLDSIELPESYTGGYQAFPHKNNLIWLS